MINAINLNESEFLFNSNDFDPSFIWGLSASVLQTEETFNIDANKAVALGDFSEEKQGLLNNVVSVASCDFNLNYKEEIKLIKELGVAHYRFLLSWSRIIPDGIGPVNESAIDFYNTVLDECLINGIQPFVVLADWKLPLALEQKGGWSNRDIINWFDNYVSVCVNSFKEKIKYWIVLDKPCVISEVGYYMGIQALRKKGVNNFLPALHHALLCQAIGFKIIKQMTSESQIGTDFSCTHITPITTSLKDISAAERVDALLNRTFIEPSLGLGFPIETLPFLKNIKKHFLEGDEKLLEVSFDFIGIQNSPRIVIGYNMYVPFINAKIIPPKKIKTKTIFTNGDGYSKSIYQMIKKYSSYLSVKKILLTENFSAYDTLNHVAMEDEKNRLRCIQFDLEQVLLTKQFGGKIEGYFVQTKSNYF